MLAQQTLHQILTLVLPIEFRTVLPGLAIVTSNAPIFHADGGSWLTRRILMLAFDHKPPAGQVKDLETEFEPELSAFTNYLLSNPNLWIWGSFSHVFHH